MPIRIFLLLLCALAAVAAADDRATTSGALESAPLVTDARAVADVLELVTARLELMPAVAAAKRASGAALRDRRRERELAARSGAAAEAMGLAPGPIVDLVELQMRLARDVQRRHLTRWRTRGYDGPDTPPDLAAELRPRIDRNGRELTVALRVALPGLAGRARIEEAMTNVQPRLDALGVGASDRRAMVRALGALRELPRPALARIRASGVLRIGTTGDYAPFSLELDGVVVGADIALARELAAALGVAPVFVATGWPTLLPDLAAGRFDVALSGISITPGRRAVAAFSLPYQHGGKTPIARCAERDRYDTLAEIDTADVRVIVNPGGTNERFARETLRAARVAVEPDNRRVFAAIAAGAADVMITDDIEVELQVRRHPTLCRTMPGTLTRADKAILMPRDADLVAAVDAWLAPAMDAGLPGRLLQHAFEAPH